MSKCCSNGPALLVKHLDGDRTCGVNQPTLKIFNTFTLNKYQILKMNNTIDFESEKIGKAYGKDAVRVLSFF